MLPAAQILAELQPQPDPEISPRCDQVGGVSASSHLSSLQGSVQAPGNRPGHRTSVEREGGASADGGSRAHRGDGSCSVASSKHSEDAGGDPGGSPLYNGSIRVSFPWTTCLDRCMPAPVFPSLLSPKSPISPIWHLLHLEFSECFALTLVPLLGRAQPLSADEETAMGHGL